MSVVLLDLETYKEIVKRLDKSKIKFRGLPKPARLNTVDIRLDKNRTPRIFKLNKWIKEGELYCYGYYLDDFNGHYCYHIEIGL